MSQATLRQMRRAILAGATACMCWSASSLAADPFDPSRNPSETEAIKKLLAELGYEVRQIKDDPNFEFFQVESLTRRVLMRLGRVEGEMPPFEVVEELLAGATAHEEFPCLTIDRDAEKSGEMREGVVVFDGDVPEETLALFYQRLAACQPGLLKPQPVPSEFALQPVPRSSNVPIFANTEPASDEAGAELKSFPIHRTAKSVEDFAVAVARLTDNFQLKDQMHYVPGIEVEIIETPASVSLTESLPWLSDKNVWSPPSGSRLPEQAQLDRACAERAYERGCVTLSDVVVKGDPDRPLGYSVIIPHYSLAIEVETVAPFAESILIDASDHAGMKARAAKSRNTRAPRVFFPDSYIQLSDSDPIIKIIRCSGDQNLNCVNDAQMSNLKTTLNSHEAAMEAIGLVDVTGEGYDKFRVVDVAKPDNPPSRIRATAGALMSGHVQGLPVNPQKAHAMHVGYLATGSRANIKLRNSETQIWRTPGNASREIEVTLSSVFEKTPNLNDREFTRLQGFFVHPIMDGVCGSALLDPNNPPVKMQNAAKRAKDGASVFEVFSIPYKPICTSNFVPPPYSNCNFLDKPPDQCLAQFNHSFLAAAAECHLETANCGGKWFVREEGDRPYAYPQKEDREFSYLAAPGVDLVSIVERTDDRVALKTESGSSQAAAIVGALVAQTRTTFASEPGVLPDNKLKDWLFATASPMYVRIDKGVPKVDLESPLIGLVNFKRALDGNPAKINLFRETSAPDNLQALPNNLSTVKIPRDAVKLTIPKDSTIIALVREPSNADGYAGVLYLLVKSLRSKNSQTVCENNHSVAEGCHYYQKYEVNGRAINSASCGQDYEVGCIAGQDSKGERIMLDLRFMTHLTSVHEGITVE